MNANYKELKHLGDDQSLPFLTAMGAFKPAWPAHIRFRLRRASIVLKTLLEALWREVQHCEPRAASKLFCEHSCDYCANETDRYLYSLIEMVSTGDPLMRRDERCIVTLVRAIALLINICESCGHQEPSLRRHLLRFDVTFLGTRELEWSFIEDDGLMEYFLREVASTRPPKN